MQLQKPVKRIFTSRSCIDTSLLASLVAGLITRCGSFGCDHGPKTFHAHILSPMGSSQERCPYPLWKHGIFIEFFFGIQSSWHQYNVLQGRGPVLHIVWFISPSCIKRITCQFIFVVKIYKSFLVETFPRANKFHMWRSFAMLLLEKFWSDHIRFNIVSAIFSATMYFSVNHTNLCEWTCTVWLVICFFQFPVWVLIGHPLCPGQKFSSGVVHFFEKIQCNHYIETYDNTSFSLI